MWNKAIHVLLFFIHSFVTLTFILLIVHFQSWMSFGNLEVWECLSYERCLTLNTCLHVWSCTVMLCLWEKNIHKNNWFCPRINVSVSSILWVSLWVCVCVCHEIPCTLFISISSSSPSFSAGVFANRWHPVKQTLAQQDGHKFCWGSHMFSCQTYGSHPRNGLVIKTGRKSFPHLCK